MAKTVATDASVDAYIAAIPDEERRADCATLIAMMSRVTGHPARMWGPGIVGFDRYAYTYDSGHSGESCIAGFASRKPDLAIYLVPGFPGTIPSESHTSHRAGLGLRYSTVDAWLRGGATWPLEVSLTHLETVSGTPGTPKISRDQVQVRLFYRILGRR